MTSSVPGVIQPTLEVSPMSHRISRFSPPICDIEVPKRFQMLNMKMYDMTTNLEEHVVKYREQMEIVPIAQHLNKAFI